MVRTIDRAAMMAGAPPGRSAAPTVAARRAQVGRLLAEGVRHHQQGRLEKAAGLYRKALAIEPRQADGLHLSGLVAHQLGDHARAQELIESSIAADETRAPYHNSLGVVLLAIDKTAEAQNCFLRALAIDPLYPEAHNNLGNALQRQGRLDEAVAAYDRAVEARPGYAEAWCNRGRTLHLADQPPAAVESLRRALALRPDWVKALRYLGDALGQIGRREEAEAQYRRAIALQPNDAETIAALAALLERANRLQEALAAAEEALSCDRREVRAALTAARVERRLRRPKDALGRLQGLDLGAADTESRAAAAFERGHCLDAIGDYGRAHEAFIEGNVLLAATPAARGVDRQSFPKLIDALGRRFTHEWVGSWTPALGSELRNPVFLVGFPRSGTTLLDQILDSHPALSTMEEKDALDRVRHEIERMCGGYPDALASLHEAEVHTLRRLYRDEVGRHLGALGERIVVDKMPLNTIDVGLIHRLFPNARILFALRHPCDVVLSCFVQAMKPNAAMVLFDSLASTARFYAQVMRLWLHYREILPLRVLTVRYEDLVGDFPGETRRVLQFLGLPWDDAILTYAERARSRTIATPSYHQVVEPIHRGSIGRWRNYGDAFTDVLPILQPFIDAFGYSAAERPV